MDGNYQQVLDCCDVVINSNYAPCSLETTVKKRLLDLTLIWEKRKSTAVKKAVRIGLLVIVKDVFHAVYKAKADEKKYGRPFCFYLNRGLSIPLEKPGGLGYYSLSMWHIKEIEKIP